MTTLPVHPGADAVLDALDPEQREVATHPAAARCACWPAPAPARPAPSPTASPTGCSPASTSRSGCSPSRSRPGRRARCAPGCATSASAGVQARTFHAAALRQLQLLLAAGRRRRVARGDAAQGERWSPRPAAGCGCGSTRAARARPRLRDRVGRRSRCSRPSRTPAAATARAASRPPGSTRGRWRASFAAYEEVKTERGRHRLRGRPAAHGRRSCAEHDEVARRRARASTATSSSTSTRTSARCSRPCSTCGSGTATSSASSATRPRPSTRSPVPRPSTCSASAPATPRRAPSSWSATTAPLRRSWRWPTSCSRGPAGQRRSRLASSCVAQRPAGPDARAARTPTTTRTRRRPSPTRIAALVEAGAPAVARWPSCSAPTARARPSSRRWPTRGIPYLRPGRRAVLRPHGGPRRHACCCAGRPASDDGSVPLPDLVRDVLLGGRLEPPGAARAVVRSASGGSRWRRWPRSPTTCVAARPAGPPAGARRRAGRARRRPSTPPPSRASRWRRCTRPRAWSGTPSSWSAAPTGCCRSRWPRPPRPSRRSVGCSTSGSPAPASAS